MEQQQPVFTVTHGHEPPVVPQPLKMEVHDQGGSRGCVWEPPVAALRLLFVGVTVGFAFAVYRGRHSRRDVALAIVSYYLFVVLACCVVKLRQLRLRRDPAAPATAAELRRVRIGTWCVSVALEIATTARIADAVHGLALKLVVWGLSVALHLLGVGIYFLFLRKRAERSCDVEKPPPAAGPQPLSLEEKL